MGERGLYRLRNPSSRSGNAAANASRTTVDGDEVAAGTGRRVNQSGVGIGGVDSVIVHAETSGGYDS